YKRREKRGKKAYQELDVFMNEEASKAHEREEEGPEVVNGESSTSARAAAEDTEITAEPGTLAETMQVVGLMVPGLGGLSGASRLETRPPPKLRSGAQLPRVSD
ncbi:hypothetical protein FOZ63_022549, partial [Perkinsus olseni]